MKTKHLFYILLSILVFSFASCSDDEKIEYIKKDQLPEAVQSFLSEYLPNNKFISASNVGFGAIIYSVKLEQDIAVEFNSEGNWLNMQSEKGLPETVKGLLSENSRKELNEKYAGTKITKLSKNWGDEQEIKLDNNKILIDMLSYDALNENVLAEKVFGEAMGALPEKMKAFMREILGTHTRVSDEPGLQHVVKFSEFIGTVYRVRILPQIFVDFNDEGEWFYMNENETQGLYKKTLMKAISKEMQAVLVKKKPNALMSIKEITRFNKNELYVFDFGDNDFVIIDSENKIVEPPLDKAKQYIKDGFNLENGLEYEVKTNRAPFRGLRFIFKATGPADQITLVTDPKGSMLNVSAGPLTTDQTKTVALPRATLEMLPEGIIKYMDANYTDAKIIHIAHIPSINGKAPPKINLWMSVPKNIKVLIFNSINGQFISDYDIIVKQ